MKRRVLRMVVVFLLAGAIVNIAVAWGCALGVDVYALEREIGSVPGWRVVRDERFGALHVYVTRFPNNGGIQEPRGRHPSELQPYWLGPPTPVTLPDGREWHASRIADARGLPMLAMWSEQPRDRPDGADWRMIDAPAWGGIKTSLTPWRMDGGVPAPRIIPLRPIWPGFAINTIFYAGILWFLFAVSFAIRKRRRIKRGLCPACAYPVGLSEVCTECGKCVKEATP